MIQAERVFWQGAGREKRMKNEGGRMKDEGGRMKDEG
jgi:hypothetical protein